MLGLENLTWVVSAAEALDFPTARFDAVTCLFGIPHLRDPWTACRKAHRFLKASGAMVLGVWAEGAHDPLARDTVGVGFEHGVFPSPTSETSGSGDASAWWRRGSLENLLRTSGFADVRETRLPLDLVWEGPGEELWRFLQETMNHLDWEKAREHAAWPKVEREVISRLDRRKTERGLVIPSSIRVAVARPGIRISNGL